MENQNPINSQQSPDPDGFVKKPVQTPEVEIKNFQPNNRPPMEQFPESGLKAFYRTNKLYVWAITVGIALIGVLGYLAFRPTPAEPPREAKVNITVAAPETVASGGEVLYAINLENKDNEKLSGVKLEIVYPEGVTYISSQQQKAANLSGTQFTVPDITPGVSVVVFVKAKVNGGINETKELKLKLRYKLGNFNVEYSKEQTYSLRLTASNVAFEIDGPKTTNNGQLVTYTLKYKNDSKDELKNGQIIFTYPSGFEFGASVPEPSQGKNTWSIVSLPAGAAGTIEVQGSFKDAQPGESRTFNAEFVLLTNGQPFTQAKTEFVTAISSVPLIIAQELENNKDAIANPGDTLEYIVRYQNNASVAVTGVNVIMTLDSKALDLNSIQAEGGQVSGNTITWNASSISALENLSPSEKGSFGISVNVKNPATKDASKELTVVSNIKVKANEYEFFPGNVVTVKIASPSNIDATVSYAGGALPPQVGKATTYRIKLSLKNASNDFSDGILTAFIPLGPSGFNASSVAGTESAKVQYDAGTGKLTWNVGALPSYSGSFKLAKTLEFTVTMNPSASQAGTTPVLINDIQFSAKDTFTGRDISLSYEDLNTADASGDSFGQGQVQE
jgi:uncharacterized repeat protein (TIGR01451 family)